MPIIPSFFLAIISFLFLKDYLSIPLAAAFSISIPILSAIVPKLVERSPYSGAALRLGQSPPILEFGGKRYSAVALSISTSQDNSFGRFEKELAYERLCRFTEAMGSFGIPTAYIMYSLPGSSPFRESPSGSQALLIAWFCSDDRIALSERAEMALRQLESLVSLVFPGAQTRRLDEKDLSLILSSPLPYSLGEIGGIAKPPSGEAISAVPPPPDRQEPSSLVPAVQPPITSGGPLIGSVYSRGKEVAPLCIPLTDIRRHVSIFGATGSGKSTTAMSLALRLYSLGCSVLILDWHGEHSLAVEDAGGRVLKPGTQGGLTINPLSGFSGKDLGFQVEFITDIFAQVFRFTPPQSYMFREALKAAFRSKITPTVSDLIAELSLLPMRSSWDHETRMALMRRLKSFTEGACGFALSGNDSIPRDEIFQGLVSIDLTNLKDVNNRTIYANILMKMVYDYCVQRGGSSVLTHVLFIEEAQNVFPPRRPEDPMTIGERILAELRKFGEGVVVISQFPSSVSQDVVKNTAVRVIHAIRSGEDLQLIAASTSMDERQVGAIPLLSVGEAIVSLPSKSGNFFVKVSADPLLSASRSISEGNRGEPLPSGAVQPN
uniref:ATP-binding protein n=1 Tax=Candidatus Methanosuratincola petrocarbonis (ex Vanwonterghem et al. 2016) TaxID=1867261 RepID=A0A7J3UYU4_9CREN